MIAVVTRRTWSALPAIAVVVLAAGFSPPVAAQAGAKGFAVEYYYKVRWGHFDEFMELYKRNHYPVLVRQQKLGRILSMYAAFPQYHAGEANRWDLRYTIVWKDVATAHDDFDATTITKELYPDHAKFRKEEQRRFEILDEHLDVPVSLDDLTKWAPDPPR